MAKTPTIDNLKKLPLRAIVAYAVRCAKRVQPLFTRATGIRAYKRHVRAIEEALHLAEHFCRGESAGIVYAALEVAYATDDAARSAAYAADAAKSAATSAYAAKSAVDAAEEARSVAHAADDAARSAVVAAAAIAADDAARVAARTDYDSLLKLNLGTYPDLGETIDPTEEGPLGRLWSEGTPDWFTAVKPTSRTKTT